MTRRELYNYITQTHKCKQRVLPEGEARCIYFENPKNSGYATLNTPIDDREMFPATVRAICLSLGIPIPAALEPPAIFSTN